MKKNIKINGEEKSIIFFPSREKFIQMLNDHILNQNELWSKISGLESLDNFRQEITVNDVDKAKQIYKLIVPFIYNDIRDSSNWPLFVKYDTKTKGKSKQHKCIFLTKYGYLVVLNKKVVVTAYFSGKSTTFQRSFIQFYNKMRRKLAKSEYNDKKYDRQIKTSNVSFFSFENWHSDPAKIYDMLNKVKSKKEKPYQTKQYLSENQQEKSINKCTEQNTFIETITKFTTFYT